MVRNPRPQGRARYSWARSGQDLDRPSLQATFPTARTLGRRQRDGPQIILAHHPRQEFVRLQAGVAVTRHQGESLRVEFLADRRCGRICEEVARLPRVGLAVVEDIEGVAAARDAALGGIMQRERIRVASRIDAAPVERDEEQRQRFHAVVTARDDGRGGIAALARRGDRQIEQAEQTRHQIERAHEQRADAGLEPANA